MPFSTSATSSSVRSMRVPVGARKCSFMRPASTDGKKSVPTTNTRARLARPTAAAVMSVKRAVVERDVEDGGVAVLEAVELARRASG